MIEAKTRFPYILKIEERRGQKYCFKFSPLLLAMKNTATSTCVLTTRILTVKVSVVHFFYLFMSRSATMAALFDSQMLASKAKVNFDEKEYTNG